MRSLLLITVAFVACNASLNAPRRRPLAARRRAIEPTARVDLVAARKAEPKPHGWLPAAYSACGLATTAAWSRIVFTTIRSNQPLGAMMPTYQHGLFARTSAMSAAPVIVSCFAALASASKESWEELGGPSCRRLNLALATAGVASALWVGFAPFLTQLPGTKPLVSHQAYTGLQRAALIGAYGSAAALSASVWARSLPEEVRSKPLAWPGRIADGVAKSLVSLAPKNRDDPVNVKYALLCSSFLLFTAIPVLATPSFPISVIPSWTGRRLSRAFPAWTFLAAVSTYNLKEAAENGKLRAQQTYRTLSKGIMGFGAVYLGAKVGAIFFDPSFPESYHLVIQAPGPAVAAILAIGLTLRPDTAK